MTSSPTKFRIDTCPSRILNNYTEISYIELNPKQYAVYAHLKPHSVLVKIGDHVHAGQQLGQLGNSGNSTAPHLHFQLSDAPSVIDANSLPFVFAHMSYAKRIVGPIYPTIDKMTEVNFIPQFDSTGAGPRRLEMPLQGDVIDFK